MEKNYFKERGIKFYAGKEIPENERDFFENRYNANVENLNDVNVLLRMMRTDNSIDKMYFGVGMFLFFAVMFAFMWFSIANEISVADTFTSMLDVFCYFLSLVCVIVNIISTIVISSTLIHIQENISKYSEQEKQVTKCKEALEKMIGNFS